MKKNVITLMLSVWASMSFAQFGGLASFSGNQQFIEDAVKNSLVIIHTQYRMQDTKVKDPTYYGADGKDYFGENYTLGVKVRNGYLIEHSAIRPWLFDSKFIPYVASTQYKPVISLSEYKQFSDTAYTDQTKTFKPDAAKVVLNNKLYSVIDNKFGNKGLLAQALADKNEGWVVWLIADHALTEKNDSKLSVMIHRLEVKTEKDKVSYEVVAPQIEKVVLGGIYVMPEVTEIGTLSFRLLGTIQAENEKWAIIPVINENSKGVVPAVSEKKSKEQPAQLTPIEKKTPVKNDKKK